MNKNDKAWKEIFNKYHILKEISKNKFFVISASQIREFREPRLMTKFDHNLNLPTIFKENHLSILPISRGEYIISTFYAYKRFSEPSSSCQYFSIPSHIQSLNPKFIINESIALNCASVCGILNDFIGDDQLNPTISGRMSSGKFDFRINTSYGIENINIDNSQIEIDGTYEGIESLSILEAKMDISEDFIIRQLYYPFRTWLNRITKPINTIFIIFSNGTFRLYNYRFNDFRDYNSIELYKQKNYTLSTSLAVCDIEDILYNVKINSEQNIPFPQANSMNRIINLIELLNKDNMSKNDITYKYEFNERQTRYYTNAGIYLNLIEKDKDELGVSYFKLTKFGKYIMSIGYKERKLSIIKQILSHYVFNNVLRLYFKNGNMPTQDEIVSIMKTGNLFNIESDNTYYRRTSTVVSWVNWILNQIELSD